MKTITQTGGLGLLLVISFSSLAQTQKPICPSTQDIMDRLGNNNIMTFEQHPAKIGKYYAELEVTDYFNTTTKWYFLGKVYPAPVIIPSVDAAWDLFRTHMYSHINYRPEARYLDWGSFWICGYGPPPYNDERDDIDGIMYEELVTTQPLRSS